MSWYHVSKELPDWTDLAGVIIGALGILFTVITLWKLMKKDKERESEIASLSNIAGQLKDMMELNEKRYKEGKMPQLEIHCRTTGSNHYLLEIKNLNLGGRITNYSKMDSRGLHPNIQTGVIENSGLQEFAFMIDTPDNNDFYLNMSYTVDETLLYGQNLRLYFQDNDWNVSPSILTLLN